MSGPKQTKAGSNDALQFQKWSIILIHQLHLLAIILLMFLHCIICQVHISLRQCPRVCAVLGRRGSDIALLVEVGGDAYFTVLPTTTVAAATTKPAATDAAASGGAGVVECRAASSVNELLCAMQHQYVAANIELPAVH